MDIVFERLNSPEVACESVGLSGSVFENDGKIPPRPVLGEQYQGRTKIANSQCSNVSDVGPSESEAAFSAGGQGGMSPTQSVASFPRRVTTSPTFGRRFLSPSQQRWVRLHRESENPMDEAFSGLVGRSPWTTDHPNSVCRTPRNGISPVRT